MVPGKKITPTTLVTPAGLIVQYNSRTYTRIVEPARADTTYYDFVKLLNQTPQMKSSFTVMMNGITNSFFMYPEIKDAYDEFDILNNRYYELAKNTITVNLPRTPVTNSSLQEMIKALETFASNLPNIKNVIFPPKRPNDLCLCDNPDSRVNYEKELRSWLKNFFAEEIEILGRIEDIDDDIEYFKSSNGRVSQPFKEDEYLLLTYKRAITKVDMLLQEYNSSDVETALLEDGLVYASKGLNSWIWLDGFEEFADPQTTSSYENLYQGIKAALFSSKFEDYILFQKNDKNFNAVFDYDLYLNHEYNKKTVKLPYIINDNFKKWMDGLKDFNRFTLIIKIDFIYKIITKENDDKDTLVTIADGTIESSNLIVSLARHDCNWELYITDVDDRNKNVNEEKFKIPMRVTGGSKLYLKPPLGSKPYSGPQNISLIFPKFNIDLCGSGSIAQMQNLTYPAAEYKIHEHDDFSKVYTTDLLQYANEIFLSAMGTQLNVKDVIKSAVDMMNINNAPPSKPSTGKAALDQLMMEYEMNKKRYDLQYNLSHITQDSKTKIQLTKSPNSTPDMLFDTSVEMADPGNKDRKFGIFIEHGGITITLKHTPK